MTTASERIGAAVEPERPDIAATVARLRATYRDRHTRSIAWRLAQLEALEQMVTERESELVTALATDLGRNSVDAWLADLAPVRTETRYARKHLRSWVRPEKARLPLVLQPGKGWVHREPLGVVGIIAPWNYPVFLLLAPLVGAIAAGNCAVLKPSEHTATTSAVLARLVPEYLDPAAFAVIEGGADETQQLLDQALDHVLFTGGGGIAKAILAGAAKHLTPVTLELGGKSPVIVADDAAVRIAARRVAWAKSLNSGQTCIAPDYVLVDRTVRDEFVAELEKAIATFQADGALPLVHERRAGRIRELVSGAGGRVVRGGRVDGRTAELTVIVDPDPSSELMDEEIFGPVLPIVTVESLDDAIERVNAGDKPLAVYLFTSSRDRERRVLDEISNGGTVINHLLYHVLAPGLPFGGVGASGTGAYHGRWGFETFSHRKAVLRKPVRPDPAFAYPPYNAIKERILRALF